MQIKHLLRLRKAVCQRNLHLHVLARLHALDGLGRVHLRGRTQDDGIHLGQGQAVGQLGAHMPDAVLGCHLAGLVQIAADQGDDFHAVDVADTVQVLDTEGSGARQGYFDGHFNSPE
ncbi:hypothetical protein D3C72_1718720 [compost metagenome]